MISSSENKRLCARCNLIFVSYINKRRIGCHTHRRAQKTKEYACVCVHLCARALLDLLQETDEINSFKETKV